MNDIEVFFAVGFNHFASFRFSKTYDVVSEGYTYVYEVLIL